MLLFLFLTLLIVNISRSLCLINKRSRLYCHTSSFIRCPAANSLAMQVPEDISYEDKISEIINIANIGGNNVLIPNTDVHPINGVYFVRREILYNVNISFQKLGAENLGTLLWAMVSFYGVGLLVLCISSYFKNHRISNCRIVYNRRKTRGMGNFRYC